MIRPFRRRGLFFLTLLVVLMNSRPHLSAQHANHPLNISDRERCAATEEKSPFALDYHYDLPLGLGVMSMSIAGVIMSHRVDGWDGKETFDKRKINEVDRSWYNEYRPAVDDAGTLTVLANLFALPVGIYAAEAITGNLPVRELATISVMMAEGFAMEYGVRNIIKSSAKRPRPYMYTNKRDEDHLDDGDYTFSFPSGHTSTSFMAASLLSYTFWKYYPESKFRIPIIALSYTVAATTGFLRIVSGNHFPSDVLTGAALGTATGFLIPFIHEKIAKVKYKGQQVLAFDGQSLTATLRF